jgi:8-oxo-dGTP pyrophosphatase MutT (NUDIX family)
MTEIFERRGVGAVVVVEDKPGWVFFPLLGEDFPKWEECGGRSAWLEPGMYGFIGGGIREGELSINALMREAQEERGISIRREQITELDEQLLVNQIRGGKAVRFAVTLMLLTITRTQWQNLAVYEPELLERSEVLELMNNGGGKLFRPFAWGAIKMLVNDLGEKGD